MGAAVGGAAMSVVGGALAQKGIDRQIKAQTLALRMEERARLQAAGVVTPGNIQGTANWLYPNLLKAPPKGIQSRGSVPGTAEKKAEEAFIGMAGAFHPGLGEKVEREQAARAAATQAAERGTAEAEARNRQATQEALANQGIPGRQQGGPVSGGEPYVVGEGGPEVVVPEEDAEVVPTGETPSPTVTPFGEPSPEGQMGALATERATSFLADPGQIGTEQYERAQEQANVGLQTNIQAMMGGLTGMGIDPRSPMARIMEQGIVNQSNKLRSEAARDLSIQQEALKRQDILAGMTAYQNFLNSVFNLVGMQADVIGGGDFQNIQNPINPYANIGAAIAQGGMQLANRQATNQGNTPGPPSETGGGGPTY